MARWFSREAILPLDAVLRFETTPFQGLAQTYPDYIVEHKQQLEETANREREPQASTEAPESLL